MVGICKEVRIRDGARLPPGSEQILEVHRDILPADPDPAGLALKALTRRRAAPGVRGVGVGWPRAGLALELSVDNG